MLTGQLIQITTPTGQLMQVQVPVGVQAGATFQVQIPSPQRTAWSAMPQSTALHVSEKLSLPCRHINAIIFCDRPPAILHCSYSVALTPIRGYRTVDCKQSLVHAKTCCAKLAHRHPVEHVSVGPLTSWSCRRCYLLHA